MSWTKDQDINVKFIDKSIRSITDVPSISNCSFLFCGFSSNGVPNKTVQYRSPSQFLDEVGSDVTSIEKYGYSGLYAAHALSGGGEVWWCRLMPENAQKANINISVAIKADDAIPVYQRYDDNSFVYDDEGNRIPVMIDDPDHIAGDDDEEGTIPQVQKTVRGYRVKWIVEGLKDSTNASTVKSSDGWTVYPIMYLETLYPGAAGNKYGLKLLNDFSRDLQVDDGRRYYLELYRVSATNIIESYDQVYYFAFNPEALVSKYSTLSEGLQEVYLNRDLSRQAEKKNLQMKYFYKNYLAALDMVSDRFEAGDAMSIDLLTARDANQIEYDEIIVDDDSVNFREGVTFLQGGHDGSLQLGNTVKGADGDIVVDEEHIEETKIDLLKKFFTGKIDIDLEDCRKIQAGVMVDCNYPLEIKRLMPTLLKYRDDMLLFFDCGETRNFDEMTRVVSSIKTFIDTSDWRYAIFPHCGNPVDSTGNLDKVVTQNYETVYKLPKIFNQFEPFCTYAGYKQGIVDTFIPDWYVSNNGLKKRAKTLSINFITDYGNIGGTTSTGIKPLWVDADYTLYNESGSVMKSLRNAVVAADLIRLVRTLFIKFRFGKSAQADMAQADMELAENVKNRYPKEYSITHTTFQSERNKITNTASCNIVFIPPDQTGDWDITIEANRSDSQN